MARSFVSREIIKYHGKPVYRESFVTDNGNEIIDIHNLDIVDPIQLENDLNQIPGVVTVGIFARRKADVLLIAGEHGVDEIYP